MLNFIHLLISPAFAEEPTAVASTVDASGNVLMSYLPFFLILGVFYFLLIRPQQKKLEEQNNMLKALKKGDKIVTSGGIIGTISKLDGDDSLMVEIANGVEVKIVRSTVSSLVGDPAAKAVATDKADKIAKKA